MVGKITDIKLSIISLYRSNYLAGYHVREMAKMLNKNHATLLPHIKGLEKDKIISAKISGKNKVYSLNFNNILTRDYFVFAEKYETFVYLQEVFLIKKLTTELQHLALDGIVILFGSYAKRTQKSDSDIDLLFIGYLKPTEQKKIKEIGKIYGKIINIKTTKKKAFESSIRKKDALITEVIKYHILLQGSEVFINALMRYYHEIS